MPLPYPVNRDSETGKYYFVTQVGITYACKFTDATPLLSPLLGVYDIEILEFEFFPYIPAGVIKHGSDERVVVTIMDMLRGMFCNELRVIVYLCDAADGMQLGRHKLFEYWHRKYMGDYIQRIPIELEQELPDGQAHYIYGCTLIRIDFPHFDVLQKELIDGAVGIITEKFI